MVVSSVLSRPLHLRVLPHLLVRRRLVRATVRSAVSGWRGRLFLLVCSQPVRKKFLFSSARITFVDRVAVVPGRLVITASAFSAVGFPVVLPSTPDPSWAASRHAWLPQLPAWWWRVRRGAGALRRFSSGLGGVSPSLSMRACCSRPLSYCPCSHEFLVGSKRQNQTAQNI